MNKKSMTALISAFSRAYHFENNEIRIFNDSVVRRLFSDEEYKMISDNMADGIGFFNPTHTGDRDMALRWIADNQLSPQPLGRASFAERSLHTAARVGAVQYLILGAGYDTFAYRAPSWAKDIQIFEIDYPDMLNDKRARLEYANIAVPENVHFVGTDVTKDNWQEALIKDASFDKSKICFCSMLGLVCYLSRQELDRLLHDISAIACYGSSVVFDYPDEKSNTDEAGERAKKQAMLAAESGEKMCSSYSYEEMEALLCSHGFLIYEHLCPKEMTKQYFDAYNSANPAHQMSAFDNVSYCLAVKKRI